MAQTKAGLAQSFDLDKYTIDNTPIEQTITIEETGDSFQITYKILSWAQRNKVIAKSLTWDDSGGTGFNADAYVRECLREMLVDAPWGKTTESFLISILNLSQGKRQLINIISATDGLSPNNHDFFGTFLSQDAIILSKYFLAVFIAFFASP